VIGHTVFHVLDQGLALRRAEVLGSDTRATALLLPFVAAGLIATANPGEDQPEDLHLP